MLPANSNRPWKNVHVGGMPTEVRRAFEELEAYLETLETRVAALEAASHSH